MNETVTATNASIKVSNLCKSFIQNNQKVEVLKDINLEIQPQTILGLLGPNGAGKTTALRIMAGILDPDQGTVEINGKNITSAPTAIKKEIGFLSSGTQLYPLFNPIEIFSFFGSIYGMTKIEIKNRSEELIEKLDIKNLLKIQIQSMSTGQKQRINIARTLLHNPSILILDEPTNGLDILSTSSVIEFIQKQKEEGKTIIYSTHILSEIELLTNCISIIYQGKILMNSTREEIIQSTDSVNLSQAFLKIIKSSTLT
jgi:sodium transport system ATP-binding protein